MILCLPCLAAARLARVHTRASTAAASFVASARPVSGKRPRVSLRILPRMRVWTMKDLTSVGCTGTRKCASAPSHRVYSRSRGFAAATALRVRLLCGLTRHYAPPSATGHRGIDDAADAPRRRAHAAVGEMGVALGRGDVGVGEQAKPRRFSSSSDWKRSRGFSL